MSNDQVCASATPASFSDSDRTRPQLMSSGEIAYPFATLFANLSIILLYLRISNTSRLRINFYVGVHRSDLLLHRHGWSRNSRRVEVHRSCSSKHRYLRKDKQRHPAAEIGL